MEKYRIDIQLEQLQKKKNSAVYVKVERILSFYQWYISSECLQLATVVAHQLLQVRQHSELFLLAQRIYSATACLLARAGWRFQDLWGVFNVG